jgi:hypothetical protein
MSGEKKKQGGQFKCGALKPETAASLAAAAENLRHFLGDDARLLLGMPPGIERASRPFDPNLVLLMFLRSSELDKEINQLSAPSFGWDDFSLFTALLERSFVDAAVIAFRANDEGFSSQWSTLQKLFSSPHYTVQDAIVEAYETLSLILYSPPDCPEDMDTCKEQVCHMILRPPFYRPPSNAEIRSYLEWFHGVDVERKQVDNEKAQKGWKLSDSRPFPGCIDSCGVSANEFDPAAADEPFA